MSKQTPPSSEFILYTTEDGQTRIECRFKEETIWLTQAFLSELYDRDVRTINEHLKSHYDEAELSGEATIRKFRIVRMEDELAHDSICANFAVTYTAEPVFWGFLTSVKKYQKNILKLLDLSLPHQSEYFH
jgi:hypothetical protein